MSRTIERRYRLEITPTELFERLRRPDRALARLAAAGREEPTLLGHSASATRVRVSTRYFTRRDDLPGWMASRFPEHGPLNERSETWNLSAGSAGGTGDDAGDAAGDAAPTVTGTFVITAEGNATEVHGGYTVTPAGDGGSTWSVTATAKARIPVLGRRIEAVVLDSLDRALAGEAREMSGGTVRIA